MTQDLVRVGGALLNSKQMKENPLSVYAEKKAKSLVKPWISRGVTTFDLSGGLVV